LGRWARDEDGAITGASHGACRDIYSGRSLRSIEGIPKVSITVLKVGTVTPLLGSKLLDPKKKKKIPMMIIPFFMTTKSIVLKNAVKP
jgi:hypothetical protein